MSKFLEIINTYINEQDDSLSDSDVEMMRRASDRVTKKKSTDPLDVQLHKKKQELDQKKKNLATNLQKINLSEEEEDVPQSPEEAPDESPAETDPAGAMTPNWEVTYVQMIQKALFTNPDEIEDLSLSEIERDALNDRVSPENANQIGKILHSILNKS